MVIIVQNLSCTASLIRSASLVLRPNNNNVPR